MTNKHKHADLIHAWADGAEIQMSFMGDWIDMGEKFFWVDDSTYRIKPEEKKPVVRWLWAFETLDKNHFVSYHTFCTEEEAVEFVGDKRIKLEWSRTEFPE